MTIDAARAALVGYFNTAWASAQPTYPVFHDGVKEPDLTQQTVSFILFKIDLPTARQSGMLGSTPPMRYEGKIEINMFVPIGAGTSPLAKMYDSIVSILTRKSVSGVTLKDAFAIRRPSLVGWQSRTVLVSYMFDS